MIGDKASAPLHPNGALGLHVAGILDLAARGDLDSQRILFEDRISAVDANPCPGRRMLIATEAVLLGRFIASRLKIADIRKLAASLIHASDAAGVWGDLSLRDYLKAEAVSVLEQLAEGGDDLSAISSASLVERAPPELREQVKVLRRNAIAEASS